MRIHEDPDPQHCSFLIGCQKALNTTTKTDKKVYGKLLYIKNALKNIII